MGRTRQSSSGHKKCSGRKERANDEDQRRRQRRRKEHAHEAQTRSRADASGDASLSPRAFKRGFEPPCTAYGWSLPRMNRHLMRESCKRRESRGGSQEAGVKRRVSRGECQEADVTRRVSRGE